MNSRTQAFHPDLRPLAAFLPRGVMCRRRLVLIRRLQRAPLKRELGCNAVVELDGLAIRVHRPSEEAQLPYGTCAALDPRQSFCHGHAAQEDTFC